MASRGSKREVYHPGIRCDGCSEEPITGTRYLCKDDGCELSESLCSECYEANKGVPTHMYAKLETPMSILTFLPPRMDKETVYHPQIVCTGCGATPIVGPRYQCASKTCADHVNLCEECYQAGQHATSHPFSLIAEPHAFKVALNPRDDP
ncbi:uncharacterized protein AMSG_04607 [Thecamonas trahens ATCC 50062]|uniref:ZZ-type domain-containing protein n=1 Tax=Thecamonas trahens ATCC 50062 TaxID=461836 RepID=A0A0L0D908_THETB|nr:hypothetical protein AMSG_04607 [Thecamonas trahens ATCC 50062]KNC48862.1 hypothetical protein AMSG_04607 [Thecamonas trahens ATCC 50062]|eukprot:XP_013758282.1 hypothetical protein AMSG_04607 [Thecamonas trahens ATCC 50062]